MLALANCPSLDVQDILHNQLNAAETNSLGLLIKGLLDVLQKQHAHEDPLVQVRVPKVPVDKLKSKMI